MAKREPWLDHKRICDQSQQAATVAGRVEEIRVAGSRVVGVGKPALQQRALVATTKNGNPIAAVKIAMAPTKGNSCPCGASAR